MENIDFLQENKLKYHSSKDKPDIKIFVSNRIDQESENINNPLYIPVRCGAIFDHRKNVKLLGDDTGDNISKKRLIYCELTVHYWAWKNIEADYYGLCHYRRYNSFSLTNYEGADVFNIISENCINDNLIHKYNLVQKDMTNIIKKYDIIATKPFLLKKISIYESITENAYTFDVKIVDNFIATAKSFYPNMSQDIDEFFKGHEWRGFNCYIMKKEYFHDYSSKLFNVLFEVEKNVEFDNCNQEQLRTIGYMGEAFWGIYVKYLKRTSSIKLLETQLVKIENPIKQEILRPAFASKCIPIVISSSDEYVPIASVLLESIKEHSNDEVNYDIIILTLDMKEERKKLLRTMFYEKDNFSLRFVDANSFLFGKSLHTAMHVTPMTYLRLAILDVMSEYEKAIYLDSDIVVNCDIADLFNIDISDYMIAAVRDSVMAGWSNCGSNEEKQCFEYNTKIVGIKSRFDYFNAGVISINLKNIRKEYTSSQLFDIAQEREWKWFDQDVFNKITVGKVKWLDSSWNVMVHIHNTENELAEFYSPYSMYKDYIEAKKNPRAIHYAGHVVPCFCPYVDNAEYFWKYARQSPFYEKLLANLCQSSYGNIAPGVRKKLFIYKIIDYIKLFGLKKCIVHATKILMGKDTFS